MSDFHVMGSCSLCGGPVQIPRVYMSVLPPTPTCGHCGAISANAYGPVIPMVSRNTTPIRVVPATYTRPDPSKA